MGTWGLVSFDGTLFGWEQNKKPKGTTNIPLGVTLDNVTLPGVDSPFFSNIVPSKNRIRFPKGFPEVF